jgi:hypothetical protein
MEFSKFIIYIIYRRAPAKQQNGEKLFKYYQKR